MSNREMLNVFASQICNCSLGSITVVRACMLSHVQLFATPGIVAHQAPLSMGFSRQQYWSRLPCCPQRDVPDPGMEPESPALAHPLKHLLTFWESYRYLHRLESETQRNIPPKVTFNFTPVRRSPVTFPTPLFFPPACVSKE